MLSQVRQPKLCVGGVGDFLQTMEEAIEEGHIKVFTTFEKAESFYDKIGVKIDKVYFNEWSDEMANLIKEYSFRNLLLKRNYFPTLPYLKRVKVEGKRIIGIHPIGSEFSRNFWKANGRTVKYMTKEFIKKLFTLDADKFLIFGTPKELQHYNFDRNEKVQLIAEPNIWDSFAFVDACDLIIGVDSAIKSYSACARIPTIVLVENINDGYRDKHYINPYINFGLKPIYYETLDDSVFQRVKELSCK